MAQSLEYQAKFKIALDRFLSGDTCTQICKDLKMDEQTLRNNLRQYGYKDTNIDEEINVCAFDVIDNEEKAYWLGFMYADGNVSKDSNRVEFCTKDKEHANKFLSFIKTRTGIKIKNVRINGETKEYYRVFFRNKKIHDDLIKNGCIPCKSLTIQFPTEDIVPKHLIDHFVRGYFDGNGCIHKYDYEHSITISLDSTYEFLERFKEIYGFPDNKYIINSKIHEYKLAKKDCVIPFLHKIYDDATIYLDRKYEVYKRCCLI